jgi:glyoxylase-like metal-dependent hydrolase (beta-lactamase superfamily II)
MSRLQLKLVTVGKWQENCYLLVCPDTNEAALFDPGEEFDLIARMVGKARVTKIILTHTDIDHVGALEQARRKYHAPVYVHPGELARPPHPESPRAPLEGTRSLREGQVIRVGSHQIRAFDVRGHSPGHVVFHFDDRALVGDAIFPGGPGRTHDAAALSLALYHLQRIVFRWPDRTILYPGHGKPTTVGAERDRFMRFLAKPRADEHYGDVSWA